MRLNRKSPQFRLREQKQSLESSSRILQNTFKNILENRKIQIENLAKRLDMASPLKKLSGGYAYISDENKKVLSVKNLKSDEEVNIYFSDGKVRAKVL